MIVGIHQPEHLPWLGFFDKMASSDLFVILDTVQFTKEDFQNRNKIKTKQGWAWLTVPVFKKGRSSQRISEVKICNDSKWGKKTWGLIRDSYKDSPYFGHHEKFFEELYGREWTRLCDLNLEIIRYLRTAFEIETELAIASELGIEEQGGTEVTLAISSRLGADVYLSGAHGKNYLDEARFRERGIEVAYQDFDHPEYDQLWPPWEPRMSSIDLLFNCGPDAPGIAQSSRERVRAELANRAAKG